MCGGSIRVFKDSRAKRVERTQRRFLDWLGKKLGFATFDGWYYISVDRFKKTTKMMRSLSHVENPFELLRLVYPEHEWMEWKFKHELKPGYWNNLQNQRDLVNWLERELMVRDLKDWVRISTYSIKKIAPFEPLEEIGLETILKNVYPQHPWKPEDNQEFDHGSFLFEFGKKLGIKEMEDWYNIKREDINKHEAERRFLDRFYNGSLLSALQSIYPDKQWIPWNMERVPSQFWTSMQNRLNFLELLRRRLGYFDMEDWYQIKAETIKQNGGAGLLDKYNNSTFQLLTSNYPEHQWLGWKMSRAPNKCWNVRENRQNLISWVGDRLHIKKLDDWRRVSVEQIARVAPVTLFKRMNLQKELFKENKIQADSIGRITKELHLRWLDDWYRISMLQISKIASLSRLKKPDLFQTLNRVYPNHPWNAELFLHQQKNVGADIIQDFSQKLGITRLEDWYKVMVLDLHKHGIDKILKMKNRTLLSLLETSYPDHKWLPWKMQHLLHGFWKDSNNERRFMDWLGKELNFQNMDDFYFLKSESISKYGGSGLLAKYCTSTFQVLKSVYPQHEWLEWKMSALPKGFWSDLSNQRSFMNWLEQELNLKTLQNLQNVQKGTIRFYGGAQLLARYGNSVKLLLQTLYPANRTNK